MKENPSRSYWKKREEQARKERAKREKGYQEEIKEIYGDMLDDVQKEIDSFYAKYARKEGISIGEAKKRASKLDIEEYARKAKKYVKAKDFSKEANEDMRLYNMTMKVNRLELLKAKIALELTGNFEKLREYYGEIITDETMKEFERLAGILSKTITEADTVKRVKAITGASFHNATFSERIWGQKELLRLEIEKNLRTALIQGKGSRELARNLRKVFDVSQYNAQRLMTTELRRAQTEVAKQSYEKNGNKKYEYMATGPHPCKICKGLDGKIFNVSDMMPGENAPPMHPLCHCTTGPTHDMEDYHAWLDWLDKGGITEEWERLKNLGKQTGGKWYKPYDKENSRDSAAAKAYRKISRRNDIKIIADNSRFSEKDIKQIKRHIFYNKHQTYDGYKTLYPDYDMAVAWNRLYRGKQLERDILLLHHELLESTLEKEYNLTISEAHARASKKYDWASKVDEELGMDGEPDGLL